MGILVPTVVLGALPLGTYELLARVPHDNDAFTQGLTFGPDSNTLLYESTGLYGRSDVRIVDLATGEVEQQHDTPSQYFGEGLAYFPHTDDDSGRLIHITWKEQTGFVFDAATLDIIEEFDYTTTKNDEGWGITYNPDTDQFIVSDGSHYLHFWDRQYQEVRKVAVTEPSNGDDYMNVVNINELEYDATTETILANIWHRDYIVRIDPETGRVLSKYDLGPLRPGNGSGSLNGIAINSNGELWVTGKEWSNMYQIQLIDADER